MRPLPLSHPILGIALLGTCLVGCLKAPDEPKGLSIAVAPLTLPSIGKVCYDLEVTNGPDKTGDTVWAKGTPGLNDGTPDTDAVCSTQYGNNGGGDITYIGTCDADGPNGERTNSVTVWFDGIYDDGLAYIDPTGPNGWRNPCVDADGDEIGCTLNVLCEENADALVEFNFTVMREANQGFFDIAVNFGDIFCSAKFDCSNEIAGVCSGPGGTCTTGELADGLTTCDTNGDCRAQADINLLHDAAGERAKTFVLGFACTAGPGVEVDTELYLNNLEFDCNSDGNPAEFTPDFTLSTAGIIDGNQCQAGDMSGCDALDTGGESLDPDDYFFQFAVYRGEEALVANSPAVPANKEYWNLAIGVKPAIADCQIRTAGTAEDANNPNDGANNRRIEPGHIYPVIAWNIDAETCSQEELSVAPGGGFFANALALAGMVSVVYTRPTDNGVAFANALSATLPTEQQCNDTSNPCGDGFDCTNGGLCVDEVTGAPKPECVRQVFDTTVMPLQAKPNPDAFRKTVKWTRPGSDLEVIADGNGTATVYPTRLAAADGEIVFTMRVGETAGDDDYIGWTVGATQGFDTLGARSGLVGADGMPFMLFKWKRATQADYAVGGLGTAEAGLQLVRVNGLATNVPLWNSSGVVEPVATGSALPSGVSAIGNGWVAGMTYQVRMTYSATNINVAIMPSLTKATPPEFGANETTVFNVAGTFPTGALGFYVQSQPGVTFRVVSVADELSDAIECGAPASVNATCGAADGANTVSAPVTDLCATGTADAVAGSGPFTWTCNGSNGGANAACTSNRSCDATTLTWGSSCSASRTAEANGFSGALTNATADYTGTATSTCNQGTWTTSNATCTDAGPCDPLTIGWSRAFGPDLNSMQIRNMTADSAGNIYVAGDMADPVDLGGGQLGSPNPYNEGFLAKYSPSGEQLWSQRFIGANEQSTSNAMDVGVDSLGNVIVSGAYNGTITVGGAGVTMAPNGGGAMPGMFLAKFNAGGAVIWMQSFPRGPTPYGVKLDSNDNIIVTGSFGVYPYDVNGNYSNNPTITVGATLTSAGDNDIFLASFTSTGGLSWTQRFGGSGADQLTARAGIGSDNSITIAGYISGQVSFGGPSIGGVSGRSAYLAKFTAQGTPVWSEVMAGHDFPQAIAVNSAGNIVVGGYTGGWASGFLGSYTSSGATMWETTISGGYLSGLSIGSGDSIAATGGFSGTAQFGSTTLSAAIGGDAFTAVYDSNGTAIWAMSPSTAEVPPGSCYYAGGQAIVQTGAGQVVGAGKFVGGCGADFGHGPLLETPVNNNNQIYHVYLASFPAGGPPSGYQSCPPFVP